MLDDQAAPEASAEPVDAAAHASSRSPRQQSSLRRLTRSRELIRARYFEDLHLAQLAECANMSPFHFSRSFRAAFGKSPLQEVVELRVELAEHLLLTTRIEIAAIARAVGFDSRTTLFRHFVRLRGESPQAMRKRQRRALSQQAQWRRCMLNESRLPSALTLPNAALRSTSAAADVATPKACA